MRPGVEKFLVAYDRPPAPSEIVQEPLDGDPAHYARLCALEDGAVPRPRDFGDYADDICHMPEVQAALLAHLLPACLAAWRHDLMHDHRSDYAGNVETFQSALARVSQTCTTMRDDAAESPVTRVDTSTVAGVARGTIANDWYCPSAPIRVRVT